MNRNIGIGFAAAYLGLRGFGYGLVLGAVYGAIFAHIYGLLFGAVLGAFVGMPLGMFGGMAIGTVTKLFFNPPANPRFFHRIVTVMGGAIAFIGTYISYDILFGSGDLLGDSFQLVFHPSLIAAASAAFVSHNYATYYLKQQEIYDASWRKFKNDLSK